MAFALHQLSAQEQWDWIRRGDATSAELVAHHLDRIARLDGELGAFARIDADAARERAAAIVGRELTVPLVAQSVVLTRTQARSTAMPERESLAAFAATGATLVLHLAITRTRDLMAELEPFYGDDCPVAVVSRAPQPQELVLRGDVGGFDAGSTFSWNVLGAFSWQFGTHAGVTYSGVLGYRALAVDFEKGSGTSRYEFDVIQHGPLIGLTASF